MPCPLAKVRRALRFSFALAALAVVASALSASPCIAQSERWRRESSYVQEHGPLRGRALLSDVDGDGKREIASNWATIVGGVEDRQVALFAGADLRRLAVFDSDSVPDPVNEPFTLANVGDVNGDGVDDLAIGTPGDQDGRVDVIAIPSGALQFTLRGRDAAGRFGAEIVGLGDVDGDGRADFAVGAPTAVTGTGMVGRITIHSGADGALLLDWIPAGKHSSLGVDDMLAATSDRDADGVRDLLVAFVEGSRDVVVTVSSASGLELGRWSLQGSNGLHRVAPFHDVDGDGIDELLCGDNFGVTLRSGDDGNTLTVIASLNFIGSIFALGPVDDLDGDGCDECFIAAFEIDLNTYQAAYFVEVRSACTGALFFRMVEDATWPDTIAVDDMDGDGGQELLIGGLDEDEIGANGVLVVSARDGSTISELTWNFVADSYLGGIATFDDLDGDRVPELLVYRNSIYESDDPHPILALSSRDGSTVQEFDGPYGVRSRAGPLLVLPDLDGDGRSEFLTGNWEDPRAHPVAQVRSGATGGVVQSIAAAGDWRSTRFGTSLAAGIELVTQQLRLAIGAPAMANGGTQGTGAFEIWGRDGRLVRRVYGVAKDDHYGTSIAFLGDVNGDLVGDWAVSAPDADAPRRDAGRVTIVPGKSGTSLRAINGGLWDGHFGYQIAAVPDADGDGIVDLLVAELGTTSTDNGRVHLYSVATGTRLATWSNSDPAGSYGVLADPLPDVNHDGDVEYLLGSISPPRAELISPITGRILGTVAMPPMPTPRILSRFPSLDLRLTPHLGPGARAVLQASCEEDLPPGEFRDHAIVSFDLGDLFLDVQPSSVAPGETVTAAVRGGPAGSFAGIYVARIDDLSFDQFILFGFLDSFGEWTSSDVTPPGLSGMSYAMRAYAVGFDGRLAQSTDHVLVFE